MANFYVIDERKDKHNIVCNVCRNDNLKINRNVVLSTTPQTIIDVLTCKGCGQKLFFSSKKVHEL